MNRLIKILGIIILPFLSLETKGDSHLTKRELADLGFENVRMVVDNQTVFATFDDPAYRGTFRGPAEALRTLKKQFPEALNFELVLCEYGISKVCVHSYCDSIGNWNVTVDYNVNKVNERLKEDQTSVNKSFGKVDVNLIPIFTLDNHRYDKLFEVGAFFAPSFETTLWKGNRLIFQPIIPIYTNLDKENVHRNLRLGVAAISQELFNNAKYFSKLSVGCFYPDAVGVYGDFGFKPTTYLDLGAHIGYAYTSLFYNKKWYIGKPTMFSAMLKCSIYDPWSSCQLQLQGGRFNFGDYGVRVDFTRHFGEYAIGLYGILTGGEHNGGFHFSIPFGGKKQLRSGVIRVKLPEYYDLQYSMVSFWRYTWEKMGRELEEIPDKNHSAHYWQAEFIEKYLQSYLDGNFE